MTAVASKNLYDLLGNDVEDENDVPKPPTKEIVKKTTSSKKRDEPPIPAAQAPDNSLRGGYGRRPRGDGNDAAFRDRGNGRQHNRSRPTDETGGFKDRNERPFRAGRGGGRGRGRDFDRHSATNRTDSDKQVAQGWGSNKGSSEWNEEQAGETIANADAAAEAATTADGDGQVEPSEGKADPAPEPEEEQEPEEKTMSYAQYMAELEKKSPVEELPEARVANEGARENKKWASAKELVREGDADVYFSGEPKNQKPHRHRKEKNVVEIDQRFVDPRDLRRGSGDRPTRGRGGPPRENRPTRGRGDYRGGGRGARSTSGSLNVSNETDFPTLGGK